MHDLQLNLKKTEFLVTDPSKIGTITVNNSDWIKTKHFKYLRSLPHT